ncbi:AMP-binding protein [Pseudaeromonas sp. ZJS20]|uniref:(2,3-dihydroxybenzoyl)adenylate synthase n=1 Tax=Pseudaeromonas aegiceratis TaxID=3153928 RepID=UPI00390CAE72
MTTQDLGWTPWPAALATYYRAAGYWLGQPLSQLLLRGAACYSDQTALICGQRQWSYSQLEQAVTQLAQGVLTLGWQPGDKVVIQLPNRAEFYLLFLALLRLGIVPVLALPAHRRREIVSFCQQVEAVAYVSADVWQGFDYRVLARQVQAQCPTLRHLLVLGEAQELTPWPLAGTPPARALPAPPPASALAFFQLSGGTTGLPKLIPRTHDDYFYSVRESARLCGLTPEQRFLCVLPAAHNYPLSSPGALGIWWAGGCVILAEGPEPATAFELVARHQINHLALVPSLLQLWLAQPNAEVKLAGIRLLQVGGAPLAPTLAQQAIQRLPACQFQQVFGMAEGLVNYTRLGDAEERLLHSQGRPISPDDKIVILDDEDRPVPVGQEGNLLTRGPYTIRGYYRAAEHNALAFTPEGFYRTGDRVRLRADGYLQVVGRSKDQINRGGEKIAAAELEACLLQHPAVAAAAALGLPDEALGERICACLVLKGETPLGLPQLRLFLRELGLAEYKLPDRLTLLERLPLTPVGKVHKRRLLEMLQAATMTKD